MTSAELDFKGYSGRSMFRGEGAKRESGEHDKQMQFLLRL